MDNDRIKFIEMLEVLYNIAMLTEGDHLFIKSLFASCHLSRKWTRYYLHLKFYMF